MSEIVLSLKEFIGFNYTVKMEKDKYSNTVTNFKEI